MIKDDIDASLAHLARFQAIAKSKGSKFIYISTINAETPNASYYSRLKWACESNAVINGGASIRLGLIISKPPKGAFISLLYLCNLPIKIQFPKNTWLTTTKIEDVEEYDFYSLGPEQIIPLYSDAFSLNDFMELHRQKPYIGVINLSLPITLLKKLNKFYNFKGVLGRILTLNAYQK